MKVFFALCLTLLISGIYFIYTPVFCLAFFSTKDMKSKLAVAFEISYLN